MDDEDHVTSLRQLRTNLVDHRRGVVRKVLKNKAVSIAAIEELRGTQDAIALIDLVTEDEEREAKFKQSKPPAPQG